MGWLQLVGSLKLEESFAHSCLFYRALLQKRPVILRSLLIVATLSTKDSATHCSIALCQTLQHTTTHCNKVLPTITALLHYTKLLRIWVICMKFMQSLLTFENFSFWKGENGGHYEFLLLQRGKGLTSENLLCRIYAGLVKSLKMPLGSHII